MEKSRFGGIKCVRQLLGCVSCSRNGPRLRTGLVRIRAGHGVSCKVLIMAVHELSDQLTIYVRCSPFQ